MELKKKLRFLDLYAISSGAMISSGIFILPGIAFSITGPGVFLAYMLAGLIAAIGILSVVELSTAMPKAGGNYFFIARSMGPLAGTVTGVLSWFALSLKSAFAIFGLAELCTLAFGVNVHLAGYILLTLFFLLNAFGVDLASRFEVLLVILLLAILAAYVGVGYGAVEPLRFQPLLPHGRSALLAGAAFVFVSYGGLINVSSISEEVASPKRNIPAGMISSVITITILYGAVLYVTVGASDPSTLLASVAPLADSARGFGGAVGYAAITAAAVLAFITTANAGVMSASRYPVALSRDKLIPGFFGRVSKRSGTPFPALIATTLLIGGSLTLELEVLVKAASSVILLNYVLASLSVMILRASRIQSYRPSFRTPFFPLPQLLTLISVAFLIVHLGFEAVEVTLSFIVLSLLLYFLYGKRQMKREFALLHIVERMTDKRLTDSVLESELVEIVFTRDELVKDRVDAVFRGASCLDLSSCADRKTLFSLAAEHFAKEGFGSQAELEALLEDREAASSTVLSPFVAIPHLVCGEKGRFGLLAVRCTEGIAFDKVHPAIKAVFFLAGSMDRRDLHLQTLAAIAQISGSEGFEKKWLAVRGGEGIRNLLLLGGRRRGQSELL
ncbi:amino acid permease [Sediminispirochaeta smaragdinae]|uniref:Amino acid permease-associated region n=1 Tax=Sediminispirochaeta smaragdinae (strain DSM 11293 / JCM 15392 / SEBR 4228) TaxID=573413 RepID=E1R815_SEDSS|nr:amino acid permease [Sediminispirochaeta smaragdinae]ADK82870.1 amino acid permease-associated region [Sediminispirochaeta smaragdinae DSM 11293]